MATIERLRIAKLRAARPGFWLAVLGNGDELSLSGETQEQAIGNFQQWREHRESDCGPLCPEHGDPRDTSIR